MKKKSLKRISQMRFRQRNQTGKKKSSAKKRRKNAAIACLLSQNCPKKKMKMMKTKQTNLTLLMPIKVSKQMQSMRMNKRLSMDRICWKQMLQHNRCKMWTNCKQGMLLRLKGYCRWKMQSQISSCLKTFSWKTTQSRYALILTIPIVRATVAVTWRLASKVKLTRLNR